MKVGERHSLILLIDLISGRATVAAGLEDKADELMAKARYIVNYGWSPAFFMIDKSRAAKAAIEQGLSLLRAVLVLDLALLQSSQVSPSESANFMSCRFAGID